MENINTELSCPKCKSDLLQTNKTKIFCKKCNVEWDIIDGIPQFINSDVFWAEPGFTKENFKKINEELKTTNWNDVLKYNASSEIKKHYHFIADYERANWFDLLDLEESATILDLGAGMGTISQALSKKCKTIYAVEPVAERVEFMNHRFNQENCTNIKLIRSDIDNLPFANEKFDLIILNGVLEWLPFNKLDTNPRKTQLYYLKLLKKFLNKNGYIYIGIENRLSYSYFLGAKDPHILIKYVTILPRYISHLICKLKINDIYRPYIYSSLGYMKLLRKSGFNNIAIYSSLPSYNEPKNLINLNQHSRNFSDYILTSKRKSSLVIKWLLIKANILKHFGYAYIIFAKNDKQ